MVASALSVIRVCATSRCVRCGSRGSSVSKTELGRVKHSCSPSRRMPRFIGESTRLVMADVNDSANGLEDEAQKSTARSFGRR